MSEGQEDGDAENFEVVEIEKQGHDKLVDLY